VESLVARYEQPAETGKLVSATVFAGLQQKEELGQPQSDQLPAAPGKAEREIPVTPWLQLLLQFPVSTEIQFVPPILVVSLNPTRLALSPGLMSEVRDVLVPSQPHQQQQLVLPARNTKGAADDSGFKSFEGANSGPEQEPSTTAARSLFISDLLRSAIIKVKTEEFGIYLVEDLMVNRNADSFEDTLRLLRPELTVLRVDLPKIEAFSSGGRIDQSLFQQHPVLFPPSVWISGKDTLPVSVNLTGFQIIVGTERKLLAPVSTR
jgi:hypothetical protein